jgi:hypothetical protein
VADLAMAGGSGGDVCFHANAVGSSLPDGLQAACPYAGAGSERVRTDLAVPVETVDPTSWPVPVQVVPYASVPPPPAQPTMAGISIPPGSPRPVAGDHPLLLPLVVTGAGFVLLLLVASAERRRAGASAA